MQTMYATIDGALHSLMLPDANDPVLPGIPWGFFDELLTPAYWRGQVWQHEYLGTYRNLRLGRTLYEETAACVLGGFGMKAELGLASFARLRDRGLLNGTPTAHTLENALSEPFLVHGRQRQYRFPRQKAQYLAACLREVSNLLEPADDSVLRDQLATLPGIGLKTASWIVRNYRASDAVAIIDVHILRAGRYLGLFDLIDEPQRCYRKLEERFLHFANAISTPAAVLDGLMWDYMRRLSTSLSGRNSSRGGTGSALAPSQLNLHFV